MVVYLDLVFILNIISDALALYMTARLSGLPLSNKRLFLCSILGGVYGTLVIYPSFGFMSRFVVQIFFALILVRITFGALKTFPRVFLLFYLLSCTISGILLAFSQHLNAKGLQNTLENINWKVFLLVTFISYTFLSVIFKRSAVHMVSGQICTVQIVFRNKNASFDALIDTGHTLRDPYSDAPVITVWSRTLRSLWTDEEQIILDRLEEQGSIRCAEQMAMLLPGVFRLIPYRAVGIEHAVLLAFRAEKGIINGDDCGALLVALSPTPVSDGEGYSALWSGERKGRSQNAV